MSAVLVDSNVLIDLLTEDARWFEWSAASLEHTAERFPLAINPIIYAEISVKLTRIEELDEALPANRLRREKIPYPAAFLAAKVHAQYRARGGLRQSTLPDFFIGAHAAIQGYRLLTRDATRYRTYFPTVQLIAPA